MTELETALQMIGFKTRSKNYRRLIIAVQRVPEDDNRMERVQAHIYEPVGKELDCSWKCVEHSIRARIDIIWKNNPHAFDCICRAPLLEPPTTGDLIEYLAEYVRGKSTVRAGRG